LRLSLGVESTEAEIDEAASVLVNAVNDILAGAKSAAAVADGDRKMR
jgi:hypothetical protein